MQQWEFKDLYDEKRKYSKDVIIASSWMCTWWAVMNHLKEIIDFFSDEKEDISSYYRCA